MMNMTTEEQGTQTKDVTGCRECVVTYSDTYLRSPAEGTWIFMSRHYLKKKSRHINKFQLLAFNPSTGEFLPFESFLPKRIRGWVSDLLGQHFEKIFTRFPLGRHSGPFPDMMMSCQGGLLACAVHDGYKNDRRLVVIDFVSARGLQKEFPPDLLPNTITIVTKYYKSGIYDLPQHYVYVLFDSPEKGMEGKSSALRIFEVSSNSWIVKFPVKDGHPKVTVTVEGQYESQRLVEKSLVEKTHITEADYFGYKTYLGKTQWIPGVTEEGRKAVNEEIDNLTLEFDRIEQEDLATEIWNKMMELYGSIQFTPVVSVFFAHSLDTNCWSVIRDVEPPSSVAITGAADNVVWKDHTSGRVFLASSFGFDPEDGVSHVAVQSHRWERNLLEVPCTEIGFEVWELQPIKGGRIQQPEEECVRLVQPKGDPCVLHESIHSYKWVLIASTPPQLLGAGFEASSTGKYTHDLDCSSRDVYFACSGTLVCMTVVDHDSITDIKQSRPIRLPYGQYSRPLCYDIDKETWSRLPSPPPPPACGCWNGYVPVFTHGCLPKY